MAENKKSIIEQALIDIELMKESLKHNASDIFRSVAKDEIKASLKEEVNDSDFDEEDVDDELDTNTELDMDGKADADASADSEATENNSNEFEVSDDADTVGAEDGLDGHSAEEGSDDDYVIDMTDADDDELISVFKKMDVNDGVEIVSDNEINIKDPNGAEYKIKLGANNDMAPAIDDTEMTPDLGMGDDTEEEIVFEIEMDDESEVIEEDIVRGPGHDKYAGGGSLPSGNIDDQSTPKETKIGDNQDGGFDEDAVKHANAEGPMVMNEDEEALDEQIPIGLAQDKRVPATNAKEAEIVGAGAEAKLAESEAKYKKLLGEAKRLEAENNEFKTTLIEFRKHLGETALFTSNLGSVTNLFLEHSTTLEEKQQIMKRFDSVKTIKESKELAKTISGELSGKKPIKEAFEEKISNSHSSSTSNILKESSTYVDPSIKRVLELMRKQ